jgi:hypothetical protein
MEKTVILLVWIDFRKEESAVVLDTRTKETTFYKQGGATEFAAQSSAQGKVQEKGYKASLPIPILITLPPMTLKDDGGLVKMFAMVPFQITRLWAWAIRCGKR